MPPLCGTTRPHESPDRKTCRIAYQEWERLSLERRSLHSRARIETLGIRPPQHLPSLPMSQCLESGRDGKCWGGRSEEHTSELQSHSDLVCRLLLEKKKQDHASLRARCDSR